MLKITFPCSAEHTWVLADSRVCVFNFVNRDATMQRGCGVQGGLPARTGEDRAQSGDVRGWCNASTLKAGVLK